MGENVSVRTDINVTNFEEYAMSVDSVVKQIELIQTVMKKVMKDGEHYGVIPGCGQKPSLLKPGAEKLGVTFRLAPSYKITEQNLPHEHRGYEVITTLTHIPTGQVVGEGVGYCSTMESKYRYRTGEVELTGKPVPPEYWKERDIKLIGGKGFVTKKNPDTGKWEIARQGEKVEHDNPADYYNTCLKMSKKRSQVDAILTATAASDIFTQDIEDMQHEATVTKSEADTETGGKKAAPTSEAEVLADYMQAIETHFPSPGDVDYVPPAAHSSSDAELNKMVYEIAQRQNKTPESILEGFTAPMQKDGGGKWHKTGAGVETLAQYGGDKNKLFEKVKKYHDKAGV